MSLPASLEERYESLEQIDSGPAGDLFAGAHRALQTPVIVRLLSDAIMGEGDEANAATERLRHAAALRHPNILPIVDGAFDPAGAYLVADGDGRRCLAHRLIEQREPDPVIARWSYELARALAYAHERGVLHRGLTPKSIFIGPTEGLQIGDFAIPSVLVTGDRRRVAIDPEATPYLPFGVLRDPSSHDESADRYAVGVIVFELLTGSLPQPGASSLSEARPDLPPTVIDATMGLLRGGNDAESLATARSAYQRWLHSLHLDTGGFAIATAPAESDGNAPAASGDARELLDELDELDADVELVGDEVQAADEADFEVRGGDAQPSESIDDDETAIASALEFSDAPASGRVTPEAPPAVSLSRDESSGDEGFQEFGATVAVVEPPVQPDGADDALETEPGIGSRNIESSANHVAADSNGDSLRSTGETLSMGGGEPRDRESNDSQEESGANATAPDHPSGSTPDKAARSVEDLLERAKQVRSRVSEKLARYTSMIDD